MKATTVSVRLQIYLCALNIPTRVQSEFNMQIESKHNKLRVEEIHHEDQRNINKIVEDNPGLSRDDAVNIYYDSVYETARPAM